MRFTSVTVALLALVLVACQGGAAPAGDNSGGDGAGNELVEAGSPTTTTIPEYAVVGSAKDSSGDPVPGATVSIGDSATTTGPDGFFYLAATAVDELTAQKPAWSESVVSDPTSTTFVEVVLDPIKIRGLRVGADAARSDERFAEILEIADSTAVNALVFDTKQEGGTVLYDTSVQDAYEADAVISAYDPKERIAQAREHGLYVITRIVTFEDRLRAISRPDTAIEGKWIDPRNEDSWEYPLALAAEACEMGFDEIQFDYVRFPSEEAAKVSGQLDMTQEERISAIESFLEAARGLLHSMGCAVSADVFAIVVSSSNDQGIGQRPEELTRHLDAFSPMVYPSHYSPGWLGLDDPNEHPYDVTANAIDSAARRIEDGTVLRPWLQAFWWTNAEIRRSIQAAEDRGVGWILWNAVSNFSKAAIPTDAEVTG